MARKLIGPKVQAAVPDEIVDWIRSQAEARRVKEAVVTRELVLAGHESLALRQDAV